MVFNRDYAKILRTGIRLDIEARKQHLSSAYLVAVSILGCAIIILLAVMRGGK